MTMMRNSGSTSEATLKASTERTPDGPKECECSGRSFYCSKTSIGETTLNIILACVLLAILVPVGYRMDKWAERFCMRSMHHVLWHEPVDDWSR
jgi:hypothetical protein